MLNSTGSITSLAMSSRIYLIVDDEPSVRAYVKAILEREQFQTIEA